MSDHLSAATAHSIICCLACSMAGTENSVFPFLRGSLRQDTSLVVAEEEKKRSAVMIIRWLHLSSTNPQEDMR
jgi:hypothetical protein